jgi:hypothetical protein
VLFKLFGKMERGFEPQNFGDFLHGFFVMGQQVTRLLQTDLQPILFRTHAGAVFYDQEASPDITAF